MVQFKKLINLLRTIAWPIHRSEFKKVFSMLLLLSFLCIAYSILRNIKDTVLLTANSTGAGVLPFIKVWGILPGAILISWVYSKLRSRFNRELSFYLIIGSFIAYFLLFTFVLFPNQEQLTLTRASNWLEQVLPSGFKGLISMVCNWAPSTFYIIAEMWGVLVLNVLFWGFSNDITPLSQAKRCYGIFNLGSNFAPALGGMLALLIDNPAGMDQALSAHVWHQTLIKMTLVISVFGLASMATFYWINRKVLPHEPEATDSHDEVIKKSKKKRLSLRECIKYISQSRYLICLSLIVLGFNIAINFTDILWKDQLKNYFKYPNLINAHMNQVTMGIGFFATIGGLLFSYMIKRLGWTFVALLTPAIMAVMGIGFFAYMFCGNYLETITLTLFGITPMAMTVYMGSLQNCLSKAGKYSVFDASKELAFLSLDPESRMRGKAAIDGLGSGIGKSGASLTYQILILMTGSIALCTPYIGVVLIGVFSAWIYSVFGVAKEFNERSEATVEPAVKTSA